MAKDIDLTSSGWIDLIFKGKNQAYGAYVLRKTSSKRHILSFVIVTVVAIIAFTLPGLIKSLVPEVDVASTEVTQLSKVKLDIPEEVKEVKKLETAPPPKLKSSIKFTPPVIKKDEEVKKEDEIKSQDQLQETKLTISVADVKGSTDKDAVDIATVQVNKEIVEEEQKPFSVVEQMPDFPGGTAELMAFLSKNIHYPVIAAENGISGTVVVRFVVSKTGTIGDITVMRHVDPSLDNEAIRVIKSMPKWIPGKQNGKPVPVYFTVPVRFKLQ